jgi:hypothetical protein
MHNRVACFCLYPPNLYLLGVVLGVLASWRLVTLFLERPCWTHGEAGGGEVP